MKREDALRIDVTLQELWDLSNAYPEEVLANPALPLLLLEDPIGGVKLVQTCRGLAFWLRRAKRGFMWPLPDQWLGTVEYSFDNAEQAEEISGDWTIYDETEFELAQLELLGELNWDPAYGWVDLTGENGDLYPILAERIGDREV